MSVTDPVTDRTIESPLSRMASLLAVGALSTGELAALRRMNPKTPATASVALYTLLERAGVDVRSASPELPRWALVTHCLALVRGAHRPRAPLGAALHAAGVSESRLKQLLEADSDVLFDLLPRLARRFAAQGLATDWSALVELALTADFDENRADAARLRIARSFVATGN